MLYQESMEHRAVSVYARNSKLAAYQSVAVHGGVADGDPHRLVLMLMDGALERMLLARGYLERGEIAKKAQALHQCVNIVNELRGALNLTEGGALALNLRDLYDYMLRQLLQANVNNDAGCIKEVTGLLGEIRGAWLAIGPETRRSGAPQASEPKR
ncbi:MAG: flagellar export chaperone FliS [Steroidobacteraceae bacterium]|jgi:flagellar protein FliS